MGIFEQLECPKCHANNDVVYIYGDYPETSYLCKLCNTVWKQKLNEKPKCPSCK